MSERISTADGVSVGVGDSVWKLSHNNVFETKIIWIEPNRYDPQSPDVYTLSEYSLKHKPNELFSTEIAAAMKFYSVAHSKSMNIIKDAGDVLSRAQKNQEQREKQS